MLESLASETVPCPVCASTEAIHIALPFTFIRHLDFSPTPVQPSGLAQCRRCQMIYLADPRALADLNQYYRVSEYASQKKTEFVTFDARIEGGLQKPPSAYSVLADLILGETSRPTSFLDIGCLDGKVLSELRVRAPSATFHGFDVSDHHRATFAHSEGATFSSGSLEDVPGQFEVISLVNVLCYVDDLEALGESMRRLLAPDGQVFIVTVDAARNPSVLLFGDQRIYTTSMNLPNLLRRLGLSCRLLESHPSFPRSLIGVAARSSDAPSDRPDDALARGARYLSAAASRLEQIAAEQEAKPVGKLAILGCTNNAAFAHSILGDRVASFADENPHRIGGVFQGKPIQHPERLGPDDTLVIPYGDTAPQIVAKFSKMYTPRLVAV